MSELVNFGGGAEIVDVGDSKVAEGSSAVLSELCGMCAAEEEVLADHILL